MGTHADTLVVMDDVLPASARVPVSRKNRKAVADTDPSGTQPVAVHAERWIVVHLRDIAVPVAPHFESRLSCIGDFDGDLRTDIALFSGGAVGEHEVCVFSPRDGTRIATIRSPHSVHHWVSHPCTMLGLQDRDQNGKVELALLTLEEQVTVGRSSVLSVVEHGRSEALWSRTITSASGLCAVSLAHVDDVNADGVPDLAVGVASWRDSDAVGRVELRSGRDGALLSTINRADTKFHIGSEIAPVPDADGDGLADLALIGRNVEYWRQEWGSADLAPRLEIHSTVSGRVLRSTVLGKDREMSGWPPSHMFRLQGGTDLNADGKPDLLLRSCTLAGAVEVISGVGGSVQRVLADPDPIETDDPASRAFEAYDLDIAPDLDGDGRAECLVGRAFANGTERWGSVGIFPLADGSSIASVSGGRADGKFGASVCWIGDSDGDGEPEFAALAHESVKIYALRRTR